MESSRQEYPALLASLHPSQATALLHDRIRLINKVNADVADWFQERRRLEENYAQGLRKLTHRPQLDHGNALGIFQLPWQRIVNGTESLATSHDTLAHRIGEDVERPLREYHYNNQELHSMPGIQSDLNVLARSLESSQRKIDKLRERGQTAKGAERLASATLAAEEANQQWISRAPLVFERLQNVDESRVNYLRDTLTQFETHEMDNVERCREAIESCLNVILNVETADEIKTFATKINGGRPIAPARQNTSLSSREPPLPPPPRIQDDAASQHSERSGTNRASPIPPPPPEPRQSSLGGLRRFGTNVMNRRKSLVQPSGRGSIFPDRKPRIPFPSLKRDAQSRDQIPESPMSSPMVPGPDRPETSIATSDGHQEPQSPSEPQHPNWNNIEPFATQPQLAPVATNGVSSSGEDHDPKHKATNHSNEPRVDPEGYSERPQTIDEITRVQREAASSGDEAGLNLTIRDQPIFEDEGQAKQAMDDMANTLRMRAPKSSVRRNTSTMRGRRDVRNTVFLPNSPPLPGNETSGPQQSPDATSVPTSPIMPPKHFPSTSNSTEDHHTATSDTTSIRSSHTQHTLSGPPSHPELHGPGLNASVVETVNAWFSEGAATKTFVVGELALAYNPIPGVSSHNSKVRFDNFEVLEKVASNPQFISEIPGQEKDKDDRRGEYNIFLPSISRPAPAVAFKYQVHVDQTNISNYCPIAFKPAWNCEQTQASVILLYSLDPSFSSAASLDSVTITNLVLTISLDTSPEDQVTKQPREVGHATSAVMYPNAGASFRRRHSSVVWKIPELAVKVNAEGKFLVRFATSGGMPRKGNVEAKFELRVPNAVNALGIRAAVDQQEAEQKESDPFADEAASADAQPTVTWKDVPTVRKLVAGKYVTS